VVCVARVKWPARLGRPEGQIGPTTKTAIIINSGGFIFIAGGSGLPYAAEGALKPKEITYRWASRNGIEG
jgi:glucosamine 6-phosphate synthetase-like amidotransferase/phosphosugar isomerase protein